MRVVNVGHKEIAEYRSLLLPELVEDIERLAEPLRGRRVLHINATSFGGGVAEILYTLVPLMTSAGLQAEWNVIHVPPQFFGVTKTFHNGLQGADVPFTDADRQLYEYCATANAMLMSKPYDFVVVHDPQPLAVRHFLADPLAVSPHWIWRCHIDTSTPSVALYDYLMPFIREYDRAIYTMPSYVPEGLGVPTSFIAPCIDPLAPKNMQLSAEDARYIVRQFGIDVDRPLLLQVSRFDPWKDPLGVVDVYRIIKQSRPDVQLALIGSMASDDPEGWEYLDRLIRYAGGDGDVFILSNLDNVGSVEINAFQSHADVVVQKSTREGFGLTVAEALWKARPTVGGAVGGIPLQIEDGVSGYLVRSVAECAERCLQILEDPGSARHMALTGKEHVRRNFLMPRLLRDYLRLFTELEQERT
ncbi:MAG: glycosyltransferase [Actinobacteria bacterium]|nr:glycosyltransferase [Actinomycetota bacterium]